MTLNTKLAFEIWAGIVVLVIVIGGVAGGILLFDNNATSSLTRTQVSRPVTASVPPISDQVITNAATSVGNVLSGGVSP